MGYSWRLNCEQVICDFPFSPSFRKERYLSKIVIYQSSGVNCGTSELFAGGFVTLG